MFQNNNNQLKKRTSSMSFNQRNQNKEKKKKESDYIEKITREAIEYKLRLLERNNNNSSDNSSVNLRECEDILEDNDNFVGIDPHFQGEHSEEIPEYEIPHTNVRKIIEYCLKEDEHVLF